MASVTGLERELKPRIQGEVVLPGEPGYDEARAIYNAAHDRRPAAVVRAVDQADVVAAVTFAADHDLPVAVRGGAHSVAGFSTCDDGLVVDLGGMRSIDVDPEQRVARADGGCTWRDFNDATHAFGLATTGGVVSTTGIAGLTLGGGMGFLCRPCGLACDNLVGAELVTAEGSVVTCDEGQNEDLLWALRGAGGNFGVVTSLRYRLHPIGEIFGGPVVFGLEGDVLRSFRSFVQDAPEQLGVVLGLALAPPLPFVREDCHGKPAIVVLACWTGALEEGEQVLEPLAEWGEIVGRGVGPMPYPVINTLFDELLPPGLRHYWKGHTAQDLPDEAIALHIEHAAHVPTIESGVFVFPLDGATQRTGAEQAAFGGRDGAFSVAIAATWHDPADDADNIAWVRDYQSALLPYVREGGYVNFQMAEEPAGVRASYGGNYDRLVELKRRYDPDNRFRFNQNIEPGA